MIASRLTSKGVPLRDGRLAAVQHVGDELPCKGQVDVVEAMVLDGALIHYQQVIGARPAVQIDVLVQFDLALSVPNTIRRTSPQVGRPSGVSQ